ncbi:DUF6625 family protein [Fulvivirga lutea]|uniref:Uncharacterized protein n=1 Tax=Fulvivirga lutea TaxID=2810512 RepID=A0A974WH64_9BACT|nr:DUF6625 family protein [Fulvivirga lutea]QSE98443.1 hypothetical protein JR347_05030 [Fulvivirga lutea]
MKRIVILIPYFGDWPPFINIYLQSCAFNKEILDVIFITDLPAIKNAPENVNFHHISFDGLKKHIEDKLELKLPNIAPYKLCDFRPAYGVLFKELVKDYDFWGYGDIDLIYGELNRFITDDILNNYDLLAFKKGHLHGPFSLYRNNEDVNLLYRKGNFKEIFQTEEYLSYDEFSRNPFYTEIEDEQEILKLPNNNISVIVFKEQIAKNLSVYNVQYAKENLTKREIIAYSQGRLYNYHTNENYIFYHWVLEKRFIWFNYPNWILQAPKEFYMSLTGFYNIEEFKIYTYLHYKKMIVGMIKWWYLKIKNYIKRKVGLVVTLDTYPKRGWVKPL